jgi:hypothetical protein
MTLPTAVNNQITDSVTETKATILSDDPVSDAPVIAAGNLILATAQALANAIHNATTAHQQNNTTAHAATGAGGVAPCSNKVPGV